MKKLICAMIISCFIIGCSTTSNQLEILNKASGDIFVSFRSQIYHVIGNGGTATISNIPDGTYNYSTTYSVPPGAVSASVQGNAAAGTLKFEWEETKVSLLYGSTDFAGAYVLNATTSSSDDQSTTSATSP